ncbi:hypothetical protein M3P05_06715 [Sansalvadorimonas sp. 2012CJ34-2]|uniref:BHLH domain-containing protein n=1 Tax=Parendozoicomonas callyspongiae TaxID=2942213 RepID=A0ABT0PFU8_9GAMM|nr:hypothetical protein [Sansalvadorimonas sp. 2012CJ34-2]MCL6269632.1 hypothetical protein [Sansalvadorimonas sp. 2012CJ34-2]
MSPNYTRLTNLPVNLAQVQPGSGQDSGSESDSDSSIVDVTSVQLPTLPSSPFAAASHHPISQQLNQRQAFKTSAQVKKNDAPRPHRQKPYSPPTKEQKEERQKVKKKESERVRRDGLKTEFENLKKILTQINSGKLGDVCDTFFINPTRMDLLSQANQYLRERLDEQDKQKQPDQQPTISLPSSSTDNSQSLNNHEQILKNQRQIQESQRQTQESQRQTQESQRQTQESQRQIQASQRQIQESQRQIQEGLQHIQESQRQIQEGQHRELQYQQGIAGSLLTIQRGMPITPQHIFPIPFPQFLAPNLTSGYPAVRLQFPEAGPAGDAQD